jgi:predicted naringenin-chalcone synthase
MAGRLSWITGVGTTTPDSSYTQDELLDAFEVTDPRVRSLFEKSAIAHRYLVLPPTGADGRRRTETQGQLLDKHRHTGLQMGAEAVRRCLAAAGAEPAQVRYLCCVTTTGLLTPGFSALLIQRLGLPPYCARLDVVGMGCNAGLNALTAVTGWASAHPGQLAVMVCIEACSAAYVFDGTMRTAVVNSLFGDGAAAVSVLSPAGRPMAATDRATRFPAGPRRALDRPDRWMSRHGCPVPAVLGTSSLIVTDAIDGMRFDWDDDRNKFSFYLDPEIPYVVGAHAEMAVERLLRGTGLRRSGIAHWLVHSGGKKVIDAVRVNLGLTRHDVRHTTSVLHDYGNVSSASFLFSYERLIDERIAAHGDYGVMMTMGPGSSIELALLGW